MDDDRRPAPRRAGWWTLLCLLVLCVVPALIALVTIGCGLSEVGDERMQARCGRTEDPGWLVASLVPLALVLVPAAVAPRRVTFAATAVLVAAQTALFIYLTRVGLGG